MRRALVLIIAATALASCSTPVTGSPSPSTAAPPPPTGVVLPPRPSEIPLDGVDPCTLLTPTQRAELGFTTDSVPFTSTAPGFQGPACAISGFEPRAIAVGFSMAVGNGIEVLTGPDAVTDQITPITVAGFPAVLARPTNPDFCSVDIDLAEGQFLDVQFRDGGRRPPIPQDQLCRDAVQVAEQAMLTLQAR